jgi:hypothetical protein
MKFSGMKLKDRFKLTLKARLIIIGSILAMVGWFLVGVLLFGGFFEEELLEIERVVESTVFVWTFRVVIIAFTALLVWKSEWLARMWERPSFRRVFYVYIGVGIIGWIAGIISLIV